MWIQTLMLLEDQGLCIQATALHCSYAKVASRFIFSQVGTMFSSIA